MPPRHPAVYCLALAAAAATAGCTAGTAPPEGEPDLIGTVARVRIESRPATVLVTDVRVPTTGYEAGVWLDVGGASIFVRRLGGRLARAAPAAVVPGAGLRAWSTGVERRSLPPQWTATRVEVTPPAP